MTKLIAVYPILFRSTQYKVGESLPADDAEMVKAWISAGTAVWKDEDEENHKTVKARPVTAEPGLAGDSVNGETSENLVGKVPKTPSRNKGKRQNG